jgi:hypothetical protein
LHQTYILLNDKIFKNPRIPKNPRIKKNEKSAFGQRFSKMDIFKNVQKPKAPNFSDKNLAKNAFVTIMLSFPFFCEKCCDANFLNIFAKKDLGSFLCCKYTTK